MMGLDLSPLDRGMDALVRMAEALERLADVAERGLRYYEDEQWVKTR